MVVKVRQVQGWGLQTPADAKLMASSWKQQMDRKGVDHRLYDTLVNMAVDYRVRQISRGEQPTSLTVELLLANFEFYKQQAYAERTQLQGTLNSVLSTVEQVREGYLPVEVGIANLLSVSDVPDDMEINFDDLSGQITTKLQTRVDNFLAEHFLEEKCNTKLETE